MITSMSKKETEAAIHEGRSGDPAKFDGIEALVAEAEAAGAAVWQTDFVESFNGKLRGELLNRGWFRSRTEAKVLIEGWRQFYTVRQPHSATPKNKKARIYAGLSAFYALNCLAMPDAGSFPLDCKQAHKTL